MPDTSGLTRLENLTIDNCELLTALPAGLFPGSLKRLTLRNLDRLQEMPDASVLTSLESLAIDYCGKHLSRLIHRVKGNDGFKS